MQEGGPDASERLPVRTKLLYASGDHTVNLSLSALALLYLFFLTEYAGLAPYLAGLVMWIPRVIDAFTDPLMGRISDRTSWRGGRRRPYFLIGAVPFGLSFALLWLTPFDGQAAKFGYHISVYIALSLCTTVLSVPYLALLPEMARGYDERTSLNTFRAAAAVLGTFAAVGMQALAQLFGGGAVGFARVGVIAAVWLVLPWAAVHRVSFERVGPQPDSGEGFFQGMLSLLRHRSYRLLVGCYVTARAAVDLIGAMFLFYFTYWMGRPEDFGPTLFLFLTLVVVSLPVWLRVAQRLDKRVIFVIGAAWWIVAQVPMLLATPSWPRWSIFAVAGFAAIGYAVADLMPWAMLGDTIDEDELESGQRRDGLYTGSFTFIRKLAGGTGVLLSGFALSAAGFVKGQTQTESALWAIRLLTAAVPALLLGAAITFALRYPLSRQRHREIQRQLDARREP
ncbi:MAG: glycoside-pentoside-hexuronide (GPH):cation symporter [Myxococcota bacterium]